jgi:1-acyl-sn-glycerol-3-phosphate acyltransferase
MSIRTASWRLGEAVNRTGFKLFSRMTVVGRENVPRQGGLLVVSNHTSMSDIPILTAALPRKLTFVGRQNLWRVPVLRVIANWYDCFPLDRTGTDIRAIRRSVRVLNEGAALVLFPEGTRSLDGSLSPGHPGAAMIAFHANVSLLPVAISGTATARGMTWIWRRPRLRVSIGRPFKLEQKPGEPHKTQLSSATRTIMTNIAVLLPAKAEAGMPRPGGGTDQWT